MPASKKLKAEYEAKGVRFVYVSMDENPVAWEKAAKQIGLDDATSYLLPNPKGNPIVQRFKIGGIPRYLLLGKDGKVLNANAPRPGETAIRTQLDAALKK